MEGGGRDSVGVARRFIGVAIEGGVPTFIDYVICMTKLLQITTTQAFLLNLLTLTI